jgi:hypothetical protein
MLGDAQVLNFNATSGAFLGTFTSGGHLAATEDMALGPDGTLYVSDLRASDIEAFNGTTGAYIGVFASGFTPEGGLAFGPDGNLYAGTYGTGYIQKLNGTTGAVVDSEYIFPPTAALAGPGGIAFHAGSIFVTWIASTSNGALYQYNGATGAQVADLYDGFTTDGPRAPVFGADGSMYVPDWRSTHVAKFDATTYAFVSNLVSDASLSPISVAFGPSGNMLVMNDNPQNATGVTDTVRQYSSSTGAFVSTLVSTVTDSTGRGLQLIYVP